MTSPLYTAVNECVPTERLDVVRVATPATRGAEPMSVAPSKKSTVPVGVPAPGGVADTVAVNVFG